MSLRHPWRKKHNKPLDTSHHKQTKSFQVTFGKQVKELVDVMEEMGNPFLEETTDPTAASYVRQAETIGQQRYQAVMTDRLVPSLNP